MSISNRGPIVLTWTQQLHTLDTPCRALLNLTYTYPKTQKNSNTIIWIMHSKEERFGYEQMQW